MSIFAACYIVIMTCLFLIVLTIAALFGALAGIAGFVIVLLIGVVLTHILSGLDS